MASLALKCSLYKKYDIRKRKPDPKSAALIAIDLQNYFSSMAKPILPKLHATIHLCRRASVPIIYTRHCHKSSADHGMLGEWTNGELIFDGTKEAELMSELDRQPDEVVLDKNTYSAFRGTCLEEILREQGVEELIVTGVMTNMCCETTARDAFLRGFRVFFSTDATATENAQLHEAALMNLAYGFAYLVDYEKLEQGLFVK